MIYLGILQKNLKGSALKLEYEIDFIFQQDDDSKHWRMMPKCRVIIVSRNCILFINIIEKLWSVHTKTT